MSGTNPFACLFNETIKQEETSINGLLEEIFGFTINPDHVSKQKLYLEEVQKVHEKVELDLSLLHYALFERLFMCNEQSNFQNSDSDDHSHENKVINYLFACFKILGGLKNKLKPEEASDIEKEIIQNAATAFQPDVYSGQNIVGDFLELLLENQTDVVHFFNKTINQVLSEDNGSRCYLL